MHFPTIPTAVKLLAPKALHWEIRDTGQDKKLYITFDDGPIPEVTPEVLEILKEYNAKATFFCVGNNVAKYPELYKRLLEEGHATGNHSFSHMNGSKVKNDEWFSDIAKCREYVESTLFRPPHGRITYKQVMELKNQYKIIMWSVLTGDYDRNLTEQMVLDNALKYSRNGSILVFHDSLKAKDKMLYALPRVLDHFSKLGFTFEKITA